MWGQMERTLKSFSLETEVGWGDLCLQEANKIDFII